MEPTPKLRQAVYEYKAGKAEAFVPLYEESKKYIYTIIYNIMKGNHNALDATEEIMNDTYLEISQKISQLREEEKFLAWAKTIATSKALYYIKKNRKYVLLDEDDDTIESLADSDDIIPEEVMMSIEKQRLVREILNTQLTEMQKLCVTGVYYLDMKQSEIAQELGIPENTVKTHLSRAKAKIKAGVEDLATNKNTKLYSVAPLMLLLFQEEVMAAVVPQHISTGILSAVYGTAGAATAGTVAAGTATAGATTAGTATAGNASAGVIAKIAGASIKAKIIGSMAAIATVAAVGGTIYATSKTGKSWENKYKDFLLSSEAEGFDLNDFDEDGVPELLVREDSTGDITIHKYENDSVEEVYVLVGSLTGDNNGIHEEFLCNYGYGIDCHQILEISDWIGTYNGGTYQLPTAGVYWYQNGELTQTEFATASITGDTNNVTLGYYLSSGGVGNVVSQEEGLLLVEQMQRDFVAIEYTSLESSAIDARIEEFKTNGNRQRIQNSNGAGIEQEEVVDVVEKKVKPSEEEMECLRILAKYFTATRWGEDLSGQEMVPNTDNVCDFIWRVANDNSYLDNWPYDKYLPQREDVEYPDEVYSLQSIRTYAKSVFDVEISEIEEYVFGELDGNYVAGEAQFSSGDKCGITSVIAKGDAYTVQGTCAFGSYEEDFYSEEPIYRDSYHFTMTLTKNADSPLGFTLEKISYEKAEVVLDDSQYEMFLEMEKAAEVAYIYNWTMDQNFTIDPDKMSALMKMNYMAQGYRFGWGNYTGEEISIDELSQAMESVTGTQVLRAEVDAQFHENQTGNYNYKGTDYAEGMVKLYVRLEAFYGAGFIDRYEIDKNQFTYYNKTLSFTSGDEVETYIDRVIKIGDEVMVYGANNRFDVPFVMYLEEDEASLTGYKLDYIYYFISQSLLAQM